MNHYIYKTFDPKTNEYYIGVRSSECNPCEDSYMGSYCTWIPKDESRLQKQVLAIFETREQANDFEHDVIKEIINDELNTNYYVPREGFCTYGMKHTEESKEKIGRHSRENPTTVWKGKFGYEHCRSKPVYQYDLDGNFIKEWANGREVARNLGFFETSVYKCCRGEYSQSNNFQWKYKENVEDKSNIGKYINTGYKIVYQFDKITGKLIKEFESVADAGNKTNTEKNAISAVCNGRDKHITAGGYIWSFNSSINIEEYRNSKTTPKPVVRIDKDTDEVLGIYNTLTEAAKELNITTGMISRVCNGKRKTTAGYKWRFLWTN